VEAFHRQRLDEAREASLAKNLLQETPADAVTLFSAGWGILKPQ
jgi:hypothetical protein